MISAISCIPPRSEIWEKNVHHRSRALKSFCVATGPIVDAKADMNEWQDSRGLHELNNSGSVSACCLVPLGRRMSLNP